MTVSRRLYNLNNTSLITLVEVFVGCPAGTSPVGPGMAPDRCSESTLHYTTPKDSRRVPLRRAVRGACPRFKHFQSLIDFKVFAHADVVNDIPTDTADPTHETMT